MTTNFLLGTREFLGIRPSGMPDRVAGGATYLVHPPAKPLSPKLVAFCSYLLEHAPRLIGPPSQALR